MPISFTTWWLKDGRATEGAIATEEERPSRRELTLPGGLA
jgi:hypothetical protein